jgi:D-threo-aldose 1-dehydrogenase
MTSAAEPGAMKPGTSALYRRLAAAPLGFGGAPLGNLFRAMPDDVAEDLVRHAYANGSRYFDTAPHYGHGRSEKRLGAGLADAPRDSFLLSTKVGRILEARADAPRDQHGYVDTAAYGQRYDYTGEGFLRSLDDSRERLGRGRVDIVYVHDIDVETHGETHARRLADTLQSGLPALAQLKARGTIAGFGLGVNHVDICLDVLRHADLDVILLAGRYTLADQSALRELLSECQRRGTAIVLGGPFNSGILASGSRPAGGSPPYFDYGPAPAHVVARVAAIERICAQFDVPLAAAALQFPRAHPAIACVIPGVRTLAEFDQNLRLASHPIPPAFWRALREHDLVAREAPLPGDAS